MQSDLRLLCGSASENCEFELLTQTIEQAVVRDPALAMNQSLIQEEMVEIFDDGSVRHGSTKVAANLLRQRPIVIPAALVLVILDLISRDDLAGEMLRSEE